MRSLLKCILFFFLIRRPNQEIHCCLWETIELLKEHRSWFDSPMGHDAVCSRLSLKRTRVYSAEEPEWKAKQRAEIRTSPTEIRPSSTLTTNQKHSLKTSEFFLYLLMIKIWKGILMWRLTKGQIQRKGVTLFRSLEEEFRTRSAIQEPLVIALFSPSKW